MMHLTYTTDQDNGQLTVRLNGELDLATADELHDVLGTANVTTGVDTVNVDLDRVTFLDSTTITELVTAAKAAQKSGRHLYISHARGVVRHVLDLTGVLAALSNRRHNN